jgi:hypothetical protein
MTPFTVFEYVQRKRDFILLGIIGLLTLLGLIETQQTIRSFQLKKKIKPYSFIGDKFARLQDILKDTPEIGYYTDKPMSTSYTEAQFTQAQYTLAPVILRINELNHPFIIFDFDNKESAIENIKKLGMIPVTRSPSGIILAKNPKYQKP